MFVNLPHHCKDTYMSRFVTLINNLAHEIAVESFKALLMEMIIHLEAKACYIKMSFPYFFNKAAPVSGLKSLSD